MFVNLVLLSASEILLVLGLASASILVAFFSTLNCWGLIPNLVNAIREASCRFRFFFCWFLDFFLLMVD